MEFKSTLWAIVIFSMIIIATTIIMNEQGEKYGSGITNDLSNDFNKLNQTSTNAETQQGNINPQSGEASSDYEAETFRGGYGIITSMPGQLRTITGEKGIVRTAADRWGIPNYIIIGFITMFATAVTLGIVAIVFRLARSSA